MLGGQLAVEAVELALVTGKASALAEARKRFMKEHGRVFFILGSSSVSGTPVISVGSSSSKSAAIPRYSGRPGKPT